MSLRWLVTLEQGRIPRLTTCATSAGDGVLLDGWALARAVLDLRSRRAAGKSLVLQEPMPAAAGVHAHAGDAAAWLDGKRVVTRPGLRRTGGWDSRHRPDDQKGACSVLAADARALPGVGSVPRLGGARPR